MFVELTSGDYLNVDHIVLAYADDTVSPVVVRATVAENALTIAGDVTTLAGTFASKTAAQSAIATLFSGSSL